MKSCRLSRLQCSWHDSDRSLPFIRVPISSLVRKTTKQLGKLLGWASESHLLQCATQSISEKDSAWLSYISKSGASKQVLPGWTPWSFPGIHTLKVKCKSDFTLWAPVSPGRMGYKWNHDKLFNIWPTDIPTWESSRMEDSLVIFNLVFAKGMQGASSSFHWVCQRWGGV